MSERDMGCGGLQHRDTEGRGMATLDLSLVKEGLEFTFSKGPANPARVTKRTYKRLGIAHLPTSSEGL